MKIKRDIIIAIDGYAGCGKSTLAKLLARTLDYTYIDTGAMYRAVTLYAIKHGFISDDNLNKEQLIKNLQKIEITFKYNPQLDKNETFLNGENVETEIRQNQEVSRWVSYIAEIPEVRSYLVRMQQKLGEKKRVVMDGRDIGTVVFPDAELKLFLTASVEERAKRRYLELKQTGIDVSFEEILHNIKERDRIDSTRDTSPLHPAKDAVIIDNTNLSIEEQFAMVVALISQRFGDGISCLIQQ